MLTIAYTTTRAATQGIALGSHTGHAYSKLGSEDAEHTMVDQQPSSARREMRAEALRRRAAEVDELRAKDRPTLPVTLAAELAANPFLRPNSQDIQERLGLVGQPLATIFAEIRRRKDRF